MVKGNNPKSCEDIYKVGFFCIKTVTKAAAVVVRTKKLIFFVQKAPPWELQVCLSPDPTRARDFGVLLEQSRS